MEITKLVREVKARKMSAEQMKKFAQCCDKLILNITQARCHLDCLLQEAQKYYPQIKIEGLLARKALDEEILAYVIVAVLSILREYDIKKSIEDLFNECQSNKPLLQGMDSELTAIAAKRVKKDK